MFQRLSVHVRTPVKLACLPNDGRFPVVFNQQIPSLVKFSFRDRAESPLDDRASTAVSILYFFSLFFTIQRGVEARSPHNP